jgi:hypothetical protein
LYAICHRKAFQTNPSSILATFLSQTFFNSFTTFSIQSNLIAFFKLRRYKSCCQEYLMTQFYEHDQRIKLAIHSIYLTTWIIYTTIWLE